MRRGGRAAGPRRTVFRFVDHFSLFFFLVRCNMGRTKSDRSGQRRSHPLAGYSDAARIARTFLPRLELLEDRDQLGHTILGVSAVEPGGVDTSRWDAGLAVRPR